MIICAPRNIANPIVPMTAKMMMVSPRLAYLSEKYEDTIDTAHIYVSKIINA